MLLKWRRNIHKTDVGYKGYFRLTCVDRCRIEFHPWCWRNQKDNDGVNLDKEYLSQWCPTPDCGAPLSKIEIIKTKSVTILEDKELTNKIILAKKDSRPPTPNNVQVIVERPEDVQAEDCQPVPSNLGSFQEEVHNLKEALAIAEAKELEQRSRAESAELQRDELLKRNTDNKVHIEELQKVNMVKNL